MILDEKALLEKLRRIEALHAGATTPGERDAAANAMRTIQQRLKLVEQEQPPVLSTRSRLRARTGPAVSSSARWLRCFSSA